jgi:hypothetical protein
MPIKAYYKGKIFVTYIVVTIKTSVVDPKLFITDSDPTFR